MTTEPHPDLDSVRREFRRFQREVDADIAALRGGREPPPATAAPPVDSTTHRISAPTWAQRRKWFLVFWRIAWAILLSGRASFKINTPSRQ